MHRRNQLPASKIMQARAFNDPAGQGIEAVRLIRDAIKEKVEGLIAELLPEGASA